MADDKSWSSRWKTAKIFTYGFVAGLLCLRAVRLVQKFRLPRPAKIQTAVLPMLRANREVRHYVGSSLKPGLLSVHTYTGGIRWRYPRISRPFNLKQALPLYYQPWAVRMLFQVIGDNSTALVTLETHPDTGRGGVVRYRLLTVDFNSGERLVLKGSRERAALARQMEFSSLQLNH